MSSTTSRDKNQKITNFTTKLSCPGHSSKSIKRPISPMNDSSLIRVTKRQAMDSNAKESTDMDRKEPAHSSSDLLNIDTSNTTLNEVLGPLINEFRQLCE